MDDNLLDDGSGAPAPADPSADPEFQKWYAGLQAQGPGMGANGQPLRNTDGTTVGGGLTAADTAPDANKPAVDVSGVPQMQVPNNPLTPIHQGLLSRLGAFAKKLGNNFATNQAGLTSGEMATMTPGDISRAKRAAVTEWANRFGNPTYDQDGFRQNVFQAMGSANQAAPEAGQQYVQRAAQAQQYASGIAAQQRLTQNRQMIGNYLMPKFAAAPDKETQVNLLQQAAIQANSVGDKENATNYMDLAKQIHDGVKTQADGLKVLNGLYGRKLIYDPQQQKVVNTITDPSEKFRKDQITEQLAIGEKNYTQRDDQFDSRTNQAQAKQLTATNLNATKFIQAATPLFAVMNEAENKNPAAYKATLIGMMTALDQKAQIRSQMLEFASKIDPSMGGMLETAFQRMRDGTFPPEQLAQVRTIIKAVLHAQQSFIESNTRELALRQPGAMPFVRSAKQAGWAGPDSGEPDPSLQGAGDGTGDGTSSTDGNPYSGNTIRKP